MVWYVQRAHLVELIEKQSEKDIIQRYRIDRHILRDIARLCTMMESHRPSYCMKPQGFVLLGATYLYAM